MRLTLIISLLLAPACSQSSVCRGATCTSAGTASSTAGATSAAATGGGTVSSTSGGATGTGGSSGSTTGKGCFDSRLNGCLPAFASGCEVGCRAACPSGLEFHATTLANVAAQTIGFLGIAGAPTCTTPEYVALASAAAPAGSTLYTGGFGSAQGPTAIPAGDSAMPITNFALADFTGSGQQQLAVISQSQGAVLLSTQSAGTFSAPSPADVLPTGVSYPFWLLPTNFNPDCAPDLLVVFEDYALLYLAGDPSGFTAVDGYSLGEPPTGAVAIVVDGGPGLAIAEGGPTPSLQLASCFALGCKFGTSAASPDAQLIQGLIAADVDENGLPDLAFWTSAPDGGSVVAVWTAVVTTAGGLEPAALVGQVAADAAAPAPVVIVPADFDQNGTVDLVVLSAQADGGTVISLFLGNGNGTFQSTPQTSEIPYRVDSAIAFDANGDGVPDLIVAGGGVDGGVIATLAADLAACP